MGPLTYEYIKDEISKSEVIFKRGENAYSLGNYSLTEENPEKGVYRYVFDGSYGNYDVSVTLDGGTVTSTCTCPFPHKGCKHVVTACLDIMDRRKREEHEESQETPRDYMTPEEVRDAAIKGRRDRAGKEELQLIQGDQHIGPHAVKNNQHREYTVTLYDPEVRSGHCTCSDYATNHLETCKHLIFVYNSLEKKRGFKSEAAKEVFPFIHITWNSRLQKPVCYYDKKKNSDIRGILDGLFNDKGVYTRDSFHQLYQLYLAYNDNDSFRFDLDLLSRIEEDQHQKELNKQKRLYRADYSFLKAELYPYQKEGVEFALFRKSAVIADEMGLGKTLQAISIAIQKKRLFDFEKVLIVSPSSLKSQWKLEIEKFTDEKACVISGSRKNREKMYFEQPAFFKITNYEALLRDTTVLKRWEPDFIILDEAQRIKNFETKTHKAVISVPRSHSLVITGTPLENKLEDIYSIIQFCSPTLLTPLWAFAANHFHMSRHKKNKVMGYKNLQIVHEKLKDLVIRRRKEEVFDSLPDVMEKNFYLTLSKEQSEIHEGLLRSLLWYISKKVLTPMDVKQIQRLLLSMRRVCDSTYLIDKKTNISPKLVELTSLVQDLVIGNRRKIIIFTEWTGMTYLIGKVLSDMKIKFVEFSGKVPVEKRQALVDEFETNPECMVFLSTDAGGAGLNLQFADCLINFELPWNPAKLNQRIGRINRIGQTSRKINVINLICRRSIEEKVLAGINMKQDLFDAVLEGGEDEVDFSREKKNKFVNQIREMFGDEPVGPPRSEEDQPELDEDTPHFLNPEVLNREEEPEIDLEAEEFTDDTEEPEEERGSDGTKPFEPEQLETVLNQGLSFLNSLSQMTTGKALVGEDSDKAVEINKETGEVTLKFKLPGF